MAYITPKTDWDEDYEPSPTDMNRIEGDIKHVKSETSEFDGDKTFNDDVDVVGDLTTGSVASSGAISGTTGTFSGAVTATTLNTGQGANELYDMDQNVTTTSNVTHNNITASGVLSAGSINTRQVQYLAVENTTITFPEGIWTFELETTSSTAEFNTIQVQQKINGNWEDIFTSGIRYDSDNATYRAFRTVGDPGEAVGSRAYVSNGSNFRIILPNSALGSFNLTLTGF